MKWQATGWEKIFANYISYKELTCTTHKEFKQLHSRLMNNPVFRKENLSPNRQERNPLSLLEVFFIM
jgi:hypothetical protein